MVFDDDYSGNGLGLELDMAMLVQGTMVPNIFNIFGYILDISALINKVDVEMYFVASGEETSIQMGAQTVTALGNICGIIPNLPELDIVCEIFIPKAVVSVRTNFYVSKRGVGILLGIEGDFSSPEENDVFKKMLHSLLPGLDLNIGVEISLEILNGGGVEFGLELLGGGFLDLRHCLTNNDCSDGSFCMFGQFMCLPKLPDREFCMSHDACEVCLLFATTCFLLNT